VTSPAQAGADGYYGLPLLKPPVWTWEVPAYFFIGGAAGAAAVVGAAGRATGASAGLVTSARWIAVAGALASPPLLISDLGRPERFLNMLRVVKLQSPVSVGAWTLVAFSTAAAAAAFADLVDRSALVTAPVRIIGNGAELVAAATGLVLATYTGVLIGATAVPVWSRNVGFLPLLFGASSLGAAASLLELLGNRERALNRIAIGTAAVETLLATVVESRKDETLEPLKRGRSGQLTRAASILSGPVPLALRVLGSRYRRVRQLAALATIVGSALTRTGWVAAGTASASAPASTPGTSG
jgi:hypothetical protein